MASGHRGPHKATTLQGSFIRLIPESALSAVSPGEQSKEREFLFRRCAATAVLLPGFQQYVLLVAYPSFEQLEVALEIAPALLAQFAAAGDNRSADLRLLGRLGHLGSGGIEQHSGEDTVLPFLHDLFLIVHTSIAYFPKFFIRRLLCVCDRLITLAEIDLPAC